MSIHHKKSKELLQLKMFFFIYFKEQIHQSKNEENTAYIFEIKRRESIHLNWIVFL